MRDIADFSATLDYLAVIGIMLNTIEISVKAYTEMRFKMKGWGHLCTVLKAE